MYFLCALGIYDCVMSVSLPIDNTVLTLGIPFVYRDDVYMFFIEFPFIGGAT